MTYQPIRENYRAQWVWDISGSFPLLKNVEKERERERESCIHVVLCLCEGRIQNIADKLPDRHYPRLLSALIIEVSCPPHWTRLCLFKCPLLSLLASQNKSKSLPSIFPSHFSGDLWGNGDEAFFYAIARWVLCSILMKCGHAWSPLSEVVSRS